MGEDEVRPATLYVERVAQPVEGHRGALDVPAGPADTERGGPTGLAGALLQPQQAVERVLLARSVGVAAALGRQPGHQCRVETGDLPEVLGRRDREVDVAVDGVRRPGLLQAHHERCDLVHRLDRPDVPRGRNDPQSGHVVAEQLGVTLCNDGPVESVPRGTLQQRVVDVGDVLHVADFQALVAPHPHEGVEGQVGGRVPQVGRVIRRDPAHVQPRDAVERGAVDEPARGGVVQRQHTGLPGQRGQLRGGPGLHVRSLPTATIDTIG